VNEDAATSRLNPWLSIWTKPRATIRQIVTHDPNRLVLLLGAVSGFSQALDRAAIRGVGDEMALPLVFLVAAIGGGIGGIVALYLGGWLLRWTGGWIGGNASLVHLRAAIAWSSVPVIWALLLWVPELAILGDELFRTEMPRLESSTGLALLFLGFTAVELVIAAWSVVVFLKCLAEVQGFSAWKALGNTLLAVLVIALPLFAIFSLTASS